MRSSTKDYAPAAHFYAPIRLGRTQSLTPEGFLVCKDVPLARAGEMLYTEHDFPMLKPGNDGYIRVTRDTKDIFRPETIASFEGKSITDDHPEDDVSPDNWKELTVGILHNVHPGDGIDSDLLLCDVLITHREAIEAVRDGKREVSAGYDADYDQPEPGRARQHNIIGNHVALVDRGRCGPRCAIGDKETDMTIKEKPSIKDRLKAAFLTHDEKAHDEGLKDISDSAESGVNVHIHTGTKDASEPTLAERVIKLEADLKAASKTKDGKAKDGKAKDEEETEEEAAARKKAEDEAMEEEEMETMDGELLEEEEEGKTKDAASDTVSTYAEVVTRAEIIAPGFKLPRLTKDAAADPKKTRDGLCLCKRRALDAAMKNEVGKGAVSKFLRGRTVDKLTCNAVDAAFLGASELIKESNNLRTRVKDGADPAGTKTIDASARDGINQINKAFWAQQKGV